MQYRSWGLGMSHAFCNKNVLKKKGQKKCSCLGLAINGAHIVSCAIKSSNKEKKERKKYILSADGANILLGYSSKSVN